MSDKTNNNGVFAVENLPNFCYMERIGRKTFVVSVQSSKTAKKPINAVFRDLCIREALADNLLSC